MSQATPALRPEQGQPIRFDLVLPSTKLGFGPFAVDALAHVIGAPVADLLAPLMTGPVTRRPSQAGPAVDVYPLQLPDGEGLTLPLGRWGELGFFADRGDLRLTVPLPAAAWLQRHLAHAIVRGPEHRPSVDGSSRVALFWLRLQPGMRAAFPLGVLGEVGIEVG